MTKTCVCLLILMATCVTPAWALGPINPTTLSWTCPQDNTDGTSLVDLREYIVETGPASVGPWTERGRVLAPSGDPVTGCTASSAMGAWPLAVGQYFVTVRACDLLGNCSGRALPIPFERALVDTTAPNQATNLQFIP